MDRVKNRSKGFGYVTFAVEVDARKALIDMNGKVRIVPSLGTLRILDLVSYDPPFASSC